MRLPLLSSILVPLLCIAAPSHAQHTDRSDSDYLQHRAASLTDRIERAMRQHKLSKQTGASLLLSVRKVQTLAGNLQTRNGTISRPDADSMNQQLTDVERTLTRQPGSRATPIGGETGAMAATFRYLFANNASALKARASTYCVGTGSGGELANPNPELMKALAGTRPKVVPASSCRRGNRVVDAAGRPALIFNLATVQCDGLDNCVFEGGYYEGNVSASNGRYRARWVNGRWQITPEGAQAIS